MKPRLILLLVNLALLAAVAGQVRLAAPGPTGARKTTATLGRTCAPLRH